MIEIITTSCVCGADVNQENSVIRPIDQVVEMVMQYKCFMRFGDFSNVRVLCFWLLGAKSTIVQISNEFRFHYHSVSIQRSLQLALFFNLLSLSSLGPPLVLVVMVICDGDGDLFY